MTRVLSEVQANHCPAELIERRKPNWKGETGRIEDIMRKHADQLGFDHCNSVAYACGHPQMVANVKEVLARARFHKDQIKEEKFFSLDAIDQ
jgi:NAD(P)H-flavin reductase